MSKKTKAEQPESTTKSKSRKPAAKSGRVKATPKPKAAAPAFDFIGRVESIRVTSGSSAPEFEFSLHGRKSSHQLFRLNGELGAAVMVMAQVVISAHDKNAKIGVRCKKGGDGLPVAAEIIWRPKLAKGG